MDLDNCYTLNTVYNGILVNSEFDLNFVFAIINSKLVKFFWRVMYSDGKTIFPKVKKSQLDKIPIPICDNTNQELIAEIISRISAVKKINNQADTSYLENQIDQLVYKLYDLTEEEITIIENSTK